MKAQAITDAVISKFCMNILPGFRTIMKNLEALDHDLSSRQFALHLMELGREQMSEVADPSEQDVEAMIEYIDSLNHDNEQEAFFAAFAGGCIMGLIIIHEVAREDFSRALRLIEAFAQKELRRGL